jgi:hypothetical protein
MITLATTPTLVFFFGIVVFTWLLGAVSALSEHKEVLTRSLMIMASTIFVGVFWQLFNNQNDRLLFAGIGLLVMVFGFVVGLLTGSKVEDLPEERLGGGLTLVIPNIVSYIQKLINLLQKILELGLQSDN